MALECAIHANVLRAPRSKIESLRTAAEIAFRVRQEVANIRLWARPPEVSLDPDSLAQLPFPDAAEVARSLANSDFAQQVIALAADIRSHRFPIFGSTLDTGKEIRCDGEGDAGF